jgi:hypothetical protein
MVNLITKPAATIIVVGAEPALPVNLHQRVDALIQHLRNNLACANDEDGDLSIDMLLVLADVVDADGHKPGPVLCELLAQFDMCAEHGCDYDGCRDEGYIHTTEPWRSTDIAMGRYTA